MDLSMKNTGHLEKFDYRHKKFDHVRISPTEFEDTRSLADTPTSSCYESNLYEITQANVKRELHQRDFEWQEEMDEIHMPRTPVKKTRISKRKLQNIANVINNAPKKRRVEEPITPMKPTAILMPKISNDALARICQYNKNMVRKFPKKERSAKDQERRDKNTIACRMSRRLKKLENLATEEQYKIFVQEHFEQQKRSLHATVYLNELIKNGAQISQTEIKDEFIQNAAKSLNLQYLQSCLVKEEKTVNNSPIKQEDSKAIKALNVKTENSNKSLNKRPFTIAFLLGNEQK